MKSFTTHDLELLVRAGTISAEDLRAICADSQMFAEWTRLLRLRDLVEPVAPCPEPPDIPKSMDVTLEELTLYRSKEPLEPAHRAAVEQFLRANFPEALPSQTVLNTVDLSMEHTRTESKTEPAPTDARPAPKD